MLYLKLQKVIQVHDLYEKVVNDCLVIAVDRGFSRFPESNQGESKGPCCGLVIRT